MKVLILGAGGREHALANAIARSPFLERLTVAPGNPGITSVAKIMAMDVSNHARLAAFCRAEAIDLVIVGPEAPLVAGVVDDLARVGVLCFGPTKAAAQLEGSKFYTKELCREANIPTAAWARFRMPEAAIAYVRAVGAPIVVKADGLAAGKGVVVAQTLEEAEKAVRDILGGQFGAAGSSVVIEEMMTGEEVSFFALCDGERALPLGSAQDHKRVGDGDVGPNTGGMGAYSPAPVMTPALEKRVMQEIVEPALATMKARGTPFSGILFAGLMIGEDGAPRLIEFNCRFGDPETQVVLPRLKDDLLTLLLAAAKGDLPKEAPAFSPQTALTVVMAAKGYPEAPEKGAPIAGVEAAETLGAIVTHAGTSLAQGRLVASGGRVLNVTGLGDDAAEAQRAAYAAVDALDAPGLFCRRDIGWRALNRPAPAPEAQEKSTPQKPAPIESAAKPAAEVSAKPAPTPAGAKPEQKEAADPKPADAPPAAAAQAPEPKLPDAKPEAAKSEAAKTAAGTAADAKPSAQSPQPSGSAKPQNAAKPTASPPPEPTASVSASKATPHVAAPKVAPPSQAPASSAAPPVQAPGAAPAAGAKAPPVLAPKLDGAQDRIGSAAEDAVAAALSDLDFLADVTPKKS
jgi:phosphoribosylamine--glycine ligase